MGNTTPKIVNRIAKAGLGVAALGLLVLVATTSTTGPTRTAYGIEECGPTRNTGASDTAGAGGLMTGASLAEMTSASDVVVVGTVTAMQACVVATGDIITFVSVTPDEVIKGGAIAQGSATVSVAVPGGVYGGYRQTFGTTPEFTAGERVALFLADYDGAGLTLTHGFQSKLLISDDEIVSLGLSTTEFGAKVAQADAGELEPGQDPLSGLGLVESEYVDFGVKWKGGSFPMAININADSNRPGHITAAQTRAAVANAFHSWQELEASFITFGPFVKTTRQSGADGCSGAQPPDGLSDVTWKIDGPHNANTLAWTVLCFNFENPPSIADADVEIDTNHFGDQWVVSGNASCGSDKFDLETVLLHEFGHFIGLDHPSGNDCNLGQNGLCPVMNAYYGGRQQNLCADDIAGATGVYPNGTTSPAPPVPANLTASAGAAQLNLAWANVDTERGYEIWRADGGCGSVGDTFYLYDAVGRDVLTYADIGYGNGVPSGETHCYKIRSYNTHAYSAFSNTAEATIGATPGPTPEPTPTPVPTPVPEKVHGDADCDKDSDTIDGLFVLRFVAAMTPVAQCIEDGDVDCDDDQDSTDALRILRHVAGSPLAPPNGCPPVGSAAARQ